MGQRARHSRRMDGSPHAYGSYRMQDLAVFVRRNRAALGEAIRQGPNRPLAQDLAGPCGQAGRRTATWSSVQLGGCRRVSTESQPQEKRPFSTIAAVPAVTDVPVGVRARI